MEFVRVGSEYIRVNMSEVKKITIKREPHLHYKKLYNILLTYSESKLKWKTLNTEFKTEEEAHAYINNYLINSDNASDRIIKLEEEVKELKISLKYLPIFSEAYMNAKNHFEDK